MPARRAMSSVDAPYRPFSANSTSAASRISSRRSSFVLRAVTTTRIRLVTTHNLVKGLGDPVEVAVREARVERERERPLEHRRRAGEVALVPVGAEQVERIRADLCLDALGAELGEHTLAPLQLQDVRLPAVHVALVRRRQADRQVAEPLRVTVGDPRPLGEQLVEAADLREPDRAEDVG